MNTPPVAQPQKSDTLSVIHEGMKVVDATGKNVGTVRGLHLGAAADTVEQPGVVPETPLGTAPSPDGVPGVLPVAAFAEPFDPDTQLPEVVRKRLRYNGFVRIDAGMLHRDRYALREQVAGVSDEVVQLNVAESELIRA